MSGAEQFSEYEAILAEYAALASDTTAAETARRNQIAAAAIIQAAIWEMSSHPTVQQMVHLRHPETDRLAARRQRLVFASMRSSGTETPEPLQFLAMLCSGEVDYDLSIRVP
ncbi:MAG TPA: hypothetical protein VLF59_03755 [Candidatus Saccharimonadales bacterium]|nr:hypothetical protein [Candidatus Saccharimonadales bacterium]